MLKILISANFIDDVPPLEDMSELLQQVQHLHSNQKTPSVTSSSSGGHVAAKPDSLAPVKTVVTRDEEIKVCQILDWNSVPVSP